MKKQTLLLLGAAVLFYVWHQKKQAAPSAPVKPLPGPSNQVPKNSGQVGRSRLKLRTYA